MRALALGVCGEDPRTLAQRRADALIALAHGDPYLACGCGSPVSATATSDETHHRCRPVIQVVVPVETLLGVADLPGVLARHGIIDPDLVRTLAAGARWQKLLTVDGTPVHPRPAVAPAADPAARARSTNGAASTAGVFPDPAALHYTPSASLAALVRTRDGHCRFPGCTTPAQSCDLDHVIPFDHTTPAAGGRTDATNLACLCRWHHRTKTAGHWHVRMNPDTTQHWTGPTGQTLTSVPNGMPDPVAIDLRPPRGHPADDRPRRGAVPVLPRTTRALTCADFGRHPDHDLPPDDHPPARCTPDDHGADDPSTSHDLDAALDQLVRETWWINSVRSAVGGPRTPGTTPAAAGRTGTRSGDADADELPPF